MSAMEVNFDGIIGPTHHYGGLAEGNLASQAHRHQVSHPRAAALQGLEKMKMLADFGIPQGVLPPHARPHWEFLQANGFTGSHAEIVREAARSRPDLLSVAYSSSFMWAANAATVSPSADTHDGRVHFTPANLQSSRHRKLEVETTTTILRQIFSDSHRFMVHAPLPSEPIFSDEGAANHNRLCHSHGQRGVELFIYGREGAPAIGVRPVRFQARQSRQASEQVAEQHELSPEFTLFAQQNPAAIDAGVFHNDVIAVANERVLFFHEEAFLNTSTLLQQLDERLDGPLIPIKVSSKELSLEEAVQTYLFNSQLLTLPQRAGEPQRMMLLCPSECETHPRVRAVLDRVLAENGPIQQVRFIDVRESMQNGGGPACLRLRVVLTQEEREAIQGNVFLTDSLYRELVDWVNTHYREQLTLSDLADPQLAEEAARATERLSTILKLNL